MAGWLSLGLLFLLLPRGQEPAPQKEVPPIAPFLERNQRQFNFYPGGKLQILAGVPGNVKVIGWQRASVLVEYERVIYNLDSQAAQALASRYPVQVRWNQVSSTIKTQGPAVVDATMEVNLTLHVPKERTDLKIDIIKGDLAVGVINGWVEATLADGSIEAKSLSGYFSGVTQQGDLSVEMAGKQWLGLGFTGVTHRGSIALRLPASFSAALQLETRDGRISIDYSEQLVEGESVPLHVTSKKNARTLSATVGDGGSPIKLRTTIGDIELTTKQLPEPR